MDLLLSEDVETCLGNLRADQKSARRLTLIGTVVIAVAFALWGWHESLRSAQPQPPDTETAVADQQPASSGFDEKPAQPNPSFVQTPEAVSAVMIADDKETAFSAELYKTMQIGILRTRLSDITKRPDPRSKNRKAAIAETATKLKTTQAEVESMLKAGK